MANTFLTFAVGPIIAHTIYGVLLPANATVISVKKAGVPVSYVLSGAPQNPRVSEPESGADWKNSTISIEFAG